MNYSGLYTTEAIFLLIIALWFARQLNCFSLFKSISDPQRILPPTIALFTGLFLIPYLSYLYHDLSRDSVILEILKASTPLISIVTFFIGQYTVKREKQKQKEKQEKIAGTRILYLLQEFIESDALSKIESSLNISNPDHSNLEKFKQVCEDKRGCFSQKLQEIKTDQSIFNSCYREELILYLRIIENFVKGENQEHNDYEITVGLFYFHKHEAYKHKLNLCKNIINDNLLLKSNLSLLESSKKTLEIWKKQRKKIIEEHKNLSLKFRSDFSNEEVYERLEKLEKKYPYLAKYYYYEDIEEDLIAYIDEILNEYR